MSYDNYLGDSFNRETGELDVNKSKERIYQRKDKFSILLMGATGVGKSTLVNAVFGAEVVKTGVGKPITQNLEVIEVPEKGLILWDTKGIEAADYEGTCQKLSEDIKGGLESAKKSGQLHEAPQVAWLCIKETSSRIEPREERLLEIAQENHIPTVVVFTNTQHEATEVFFNEAKQILSQKFPFLEDRFVRVNSCAYKIMGVEVGISGLPELLEMTEKCWAKDGERVSKARLNAFRKAQEVDKKERLAAMVQGARNKVHAAAVAAGTAGLSPIPMSDAPIIAAIQATMVHAINSEFELNKEDGYMTTIVTGVLGASTIAQVGKTVVTSILKMIPGVGTVLGGAVSGAVAASITEAIGLAYVAVLEKQYNMETGKVELPESATTLLEYFTAQHKQMKK